MRKKTWLLLGVGLLVPGLLGAQTVINEIRVDGNGSVDQEYFELAGSPGSSLTGCYYLVIGDSTGGLSGVVEHVTDLSGFAIQPDGFFLAVDTGSGSLYALPGIPDLDTSLNFENSDNVTHMLVLGFTGAVGDDLDTDDDGVLDSTPWSSIEDSVAIVEDPGLLIAGSEHYYSSTIVGPDGAFMPGTVKRCPDITGPWAIGAFDPPTDDSPDALNVCTFPEDCEDGVDNDLDGDLDCADADCVGDLACAPPPVNDLCASASAIGEGTTPFTTAGAHTDGPNTCGGNLENDVWFEYSPTSSGTTLFSTCGTASAGFNPQMAIYDAAAGCPTSDTWLECDAGSCTGSGEPEITFDVIGGESYLIQIGGFNGDRGDAALTISADCHIFGSPAYIASFVAAIVAGATPGTDILAPPATLEFLNVTGVGTISDVDLHLNITHPFIGDLRIILVSPGGTQLTIHEGGGGSQDDIDVIFDDGGVAYDSVNFSGGVRMQIQDPIFTLADLNGENADGAWVLSHQDDCVICSPTPPPRGTLDSWELLFPILFAIPDNDLVGLDTTVVVTDPDAVLDLDVQLDVSHGDTSQLTVSLSSPGGTSVTLHDGGAGVDLTGHYDDDAGLGGTNDGYGNTIPSGPGILADFDGELAAGTWTMNFVDSAAGTVGNVNGWNLLVCPGTPPPSGGFRRGDCNGSGGFDIADAVFGLGYLFPPTGGTGSVLPCDDSCDSNDDGLLNIADPVASLGYLFPPSGVPVPLPAPFGACGPDPTADSLTCGTFTPCP